LSDSNFMTVLKNMAEDVELKDLVVKNMSTNDKADPLYVNKFINLTDFNTARNSIINNHISKNYALAVAQADAILNDDNFNLDEFQIIQLMNFKANALLEMKEYSQAEKILNTALMDAKKILNWSPLAK